MAPYRIYTRSNPRANTPDMEATIFGSNRSGRRTLTVPPGLSRNKKDTVLTSTRTLGAPLIHQGLYGMRGKIKPITNGLCIEDGKNTPPPGGTDTTKLYILNSGPPHTVIINLGKIKTCNILGCLCTAYPICLNTKSDTEGAESHQKYPLY